jgi:hypothetical protein
LAIRNLSNDDLGRILAYSQVVFNEENTTKEWEDGLDWTLGTHRDSLELKNKVVSSSQYAQYLSSEISFKNLDGTKSVCWIKVDSLSVDNNTVYIEVNMPELRSNCTSFSYTYRAKSKYFKRSKRNVEYEMLENNWLLIIDNSNPCIE